MPRTHHEPREHERPHRAGHAHTITGSGRNRIEDSSAGGTHTEREDHPWEIEIPDHPGRTESGEFRAAKGAAHKILAAIRQQDSGGLLASLAGPGGVQAHHAGSLFVFSGGKWALFLNSAGVEWSAQWAADPARVDLLRQNAAALYERFPETLDEFARLGYTQARDILATPITDHGGVAAWTDSIFNSCVLLSPALHQGLNPEHTQVGGWHHFPKSIWDQQITKRDDFQLWVTTEDGLPAAVAPMGHRGSGDGRVRVLWAHPSSHLHHEHRQHMERGEEHILPEDHDLAKQAFARQNTTQEA